MLKTKILLLNIAIFISFLSFAGAAENSSALDDLKALAPAAEATVQPAPEILPPQPPVLEAEKVIQPGRDLSPKVEDQARIKAILKLVIDVYNNVHLPYSQDGATFTNKEGRLPKQPLGYYKEYTLLTGDAPHTVVIGGQTYQVAPDLSARGSERVIIGGGSLLYYTPDHYAHFIQLTVVQ